MENGYKDMLKSIFVRFEFDEMAWLNCLKNMMFWACTCLNNFAYYVFDEMLMNASMLIGLTSHVTCLELFVKMNMCII